jgi:hypothetical protein
VCERGNSFTREKLTLGKNTHTGFDFNAKNCINTKFFLFISSMIIADYSAYISELPKDELKMRSTGNPV